MAEETKTQQPPENPDLNQDQDTDKAKNGPAQPPAATETKPEKKSAPSVSAKAPAPASRTPESLTDLLKGLEDHEVNEIWSKAKAFISQGLPAATSLHMILADIESFLRAK